MCPYSSSKLWKCRVNVSSVSYSSSFVLVKVTLVKTVFVFIAFPFAFFSSFIAFYHTSLGEGVKYSSEMLLSSSSKSLYIYSFWRFCFIHPGSSSSPEPVSMRISETLQDILHLSSFLLPGFSVSHLQQKYRNVLSRKEVHRIYWQISLLFPSL